MKEYMHTINHNANAMYRTHVEALDRIEQLEMQQKDLKAYAIYKGVKADMKEYDRTALKKMISHEEICLDLKEADKLKWAMEYE